MDGEIEAYKQLQEQMKKEEISNAEMNAELEIMMVKRAKVNFNFNLA